MTYSSRTTAQLAGCSYRQLDYWCRTGTLPCAEAASGSGSRRRFTTEQVAMARLCAQLAELGADRDVLREAVALVAELPLVLWDGELVATREHVYHRWQIGGPLPAACWVVDLASCRPHVPEQLVLAS